jgi:hypothetical protein
MISSRLWESSEEAMGKSITLNPAVDNLKSADFFQQPVAMARPQSSMVFRIQRVSIAPGIGATIALN